MGVLSGKLNYLGMDYAPSKNTAGDVYEIVVKKFSDCIILS